MKAVAVSVLAVSLGAIGTIGAKELLSSHADNSRPPATVAAETTAEGTEQQPCWTDSAIKSDRFSLRGAEGAVRSFEIHKLEGCVFRVKLEYGTAASSASKLLDYEAEYVTGDAPTFIRYNSPP